MEGEVHLRVHVSAEGIVKQAVVLHSDNPAFDQAAQIAAMQWEFTPASKGGKPVDVWIPLPMRFKLKTSLAVKYTGEAR
jgi:protein TonB